MDSSVGIANNFIEANHFVDMVLSSAVICSMMWRSGDQERTLDDRRAMTTLTTLTTPTATTTIKQYIGDEVTTAVTTATMAPVRRQAARSIPRRCWAAMLRRRLTTTTLNSHDDERR